MALYIPHSIFHLARLLCIRPETFGPYYVTLFLNLSVVADPSQISLIGRTPFQKLSKIVESLVTTRDTFKVKIFKN